MFRTHDRAFVLVWRILFGALLAFEILVFLKLIPITPTFTTFGLLLTLGGVWIGVEYTYHLFKHKEYTHSLPGWTTLLIPLTVYLDASGDFLHFYTIFPQYDAFLHFINPAIGCLWAWQFLHVLYPKVPTRFVLFASSMFMISASALYEVEEYLEDVLTGSHRLGTAWDTGNDLVMDMLGTLLSVILILLFLHHKQKEHRQATLFSKNS